MTAKRGPGRPRLNPDERRSCNVTTVIIPSLYTKLKEAASASDRSLSQEMANRLERSFDLDLALLLKTLIVRMQSMQ